MQLIKNTIKMLDDITMLDHNVQQKEENEEEEERNATCFLQTTCTNVPVLSTPTPVVISTITKLRTTTTTTKINAAIEVNNNLQIKYKNNNSNNNNNKKNKNNSNYININNKKLEDDDNKNYSMKSVSGSSCCQRCCEHKNHDAEEEEEEKQPAVQRHEVKYTKTTTTNVRNVRNSDNNNNVECSKQGKLFEKHHCTAASLLIVEEQQQRQRQFSANPTTTQTTKCDEMSNMRSDTERDTKIKLQTPFAVKKCATVESSSSSSTTTTTKILPFRLIGIGRTKNRPTPEPTTTTTTKRRTIEISSLLSHREASTITLPQILLKAANSQAQVESRMLLPANLKDLKDNLKNDDENDLRCNLNDEDVDSVKFYSRNSMQLVMPIEENNNNNNNNMMMHQVQEQLLKKNNRTTRIYHNNNKNKKTQINKSCSTVSSDKCFKPSLAVEATKHIPLAATLSSITIFRKLLATLALMVATSIRKITTSSSSPSSSWLSTSFTLLLLTTTAYCWNGRQDAMTNCTFPARWEGSWFLSGYQQSIHIKGSQFSYRGKCLASDGNKYLIVDEKGCHRCLVIYEKHKNVLQYKESECEGDSMYMHQANPPSALAMRSALLKQSQIAGGEHRGGAHPNIPNSELNTNTNTHPNIANGNTRLSSSDQFILRSNDDMNDYFCKGRETLQNLCDQIPGDALLYSLFRENADPVKCPLRGPFVFTYNRGHGECKSPLSNIESCTEESHLLLSFQACPDVQGTESTVEELTCLATWKDGNSRYLVGLVSHHHAISNEERYRCFVYEKLTALGLAGAPAPVNVNKDAEYKLAQSGDATCNGLDSAEVGSRIMSLRKPPLAERCDFPSWFKGPRHWHALMGNAVYNYHMSDGSVHVIKPNGYMETRALCEQINKQTSDEMMAVVHYTTGCQSGFMCMMFYRRDTHVIEIQTGKPAARLEDACAPDHFDIMRMPFITLLASNPDPQECPMVGLYNLRGAIGPPYLTTRHKRNHSNKSHGNHAHHHQQQLQQQQESELTATGHENVAYIGHKRHINSNLNYRNADLTEITTRNRRALDKQQRELRIMPDEVNSSSSSSNSGTNDDASLTTRNRRNVPPCITNVKAQRRLWVGCTAPNFIDVRPLCTNDGDEEYSCHGSWMENGTTYIIARHEGTKHGVCISYRPTEGNAAKLVIGDACYRGMDPPPEHHLVANLSVFGKCGDTGNGAGVARRSTCFASWLALVVLALCISSMGHWQDMQQR